VASTRLVFDYDGQRTVLVESHSELPLQVQRAIRRPGGQAVVTLLTPAGALFGGDRVRLYVECRSGTRVVIRQVGATKLHRCEGAGIELDAEIHVAAGARFAYQPFELIPFAGSEYRQHLRVFLESGAEALLSEVVSPGRLGEQFGYRRLELCTEAWLDGRRMLLDAQRIVPAEMDCAQLLAGFTHFGTLIHLGAGLGQPEADRLHERFQELGVTGSASALPAYGVGGRVVGTSADCLLRTFHEAEI
jgi:urease accessory protein